MENKLYSDQLLLAAQTLCVNLTQSAADIMLSYLDLVLEENENINLTAIKEKGEAVLLHIVDSLALLGAACFDTVSASVLDVGSGAGFPAAVIAAAREDLNVTALDGTGKRVNFISAAARKLDIKNLTAVHGRAELLGRDVPPRGSFDIVTARAVAPLPQLCEYCLPFLKPGGTFAAMKAGGSEEELISAKNALLELGATHAESFCFTLPESDIKRVIYLFKKTKGTDKKYPRPSAIIKKRPL